MELLMAVAQKRAKAYTLEGGGTSLSTLKVVCTVALEVTRHASGCHVSLQC